MSELVVHSSPPPLSVGGEVVDPFGLAPRAAELAARQRSPETRRTYAAVYRCFVAFLGSDAVAADVTPEAVRAYRDALERAGRAPATVAKHLSALRSLADAVGADAAIKGVRSARVARASRERSIRTSGRGCCGCRIAGRVRASGISRCCICSARRGCAGPKPPACW